MQSLIFVSDDSPALPAVSTRISRALPPIGSNVPSEVSPATNNNQNEVRQTAHLSDIHLSDIEPIEQWFPTSPVCPTGERFEFLKEKF